MFRGEENNNKRVLAKNENVKLKMTFFEREIGFDSEAGDCDGSSGFSFYFRIQRQIGERAVPHAGRAHFRDWPTQVKRRRKLGGTKVIIHSMSF